MSKNDAPSAADQRAPTGLRRGGILAAGSIAASGITTLCSLAATLLILRALPREEAGRFALLVELLYSVGLLGTLGQSILQARLYYQEGAGAFDWVRDAWSTIWTTTPIVAISVTAVAGPYQLTSFEAIFVFAGAELFVLTSCFSAVLAQQRHYAWASALLRLGNGLLILPAVFMLANRSLCRLEFVLGSLLLFLSIVVVVGIVLLGRWVERGSGSISLRQRISGLVFLASLVALVVPQRGLIVIAGAMLNPATVAALAAVISILRVFDLVGESAGRVFSTEMAQHPGRIGLGLFAAPWLLMGLMVAAVMIGLPPMIHHL